MDFYIELGDYVTSTIFFTGNKIIRIKPTIHKLKSPLIFMMLANIDCPENQYRVPLRIYYII